MKDEGNLKSKAELFAVLRRTGVSEKTIQELDARLPDPIDAGRDADVLLRYGITLDAMIDRMGGSP
jgi:hypothetical protein